MKLRFGVLFIAYTMFCSFPVFDLKGADMGQGGDQDEDEEGQGGRAVDENTLIAEAGALATNILRKPGWMKVWRGPDGSEIQVNLRTEVNKFLDLKPDEKFRGAVSLLEYYEKLRGAFENQQDELSQPVVVEGNARHLVSGTLVTLPASLEEQERHQAYLDTPEAQEAFRVQQEENAKRFLEKIKKEGPKVVGRVWLDFEAVLSMARDSGFPTENRRMHGRLKREFRRIAREDGLLQDSEKETMEQVIQKLMVENDRIEAERKKAGEEEGERQYQLCLDRLRNDCLLVDFEAPDLRYGLNPVLIPTVVLKAVQTALADYLKICNYRGIKPALLYNDLQQVEEDLNDDEVDVKVWDEVIEIYGHILKAEEACDIGLTELVKHPEAFMKAFNRFAQVNNGENEDCSFLFQQLKNRSSLDLNSVFEFCVKEDDLGKQLFLNKLIHDPVAFMNVFEYYLRPLSKSQVGFLADTNQNYCDILFQALRNDMGAWGSVLSMCCEQKRSRGYGFLCSKARERAIEPLQEQPDDVEQVHVQEQPDGVGGQPVVEERQPDDVEQVHAQEQPGDVGGQPVVEERQPGDVEQGRGFWSLPVVAGIGGLSIVAFVWYYQDFIIKLLSRRNS